MHKTLKAWIALSNGHVQTGMDGLPLIFKTKARAADGGFRAIPATLKFYVPRKDRWGREIDECGQIPCKVKGCLTSINYDYPDGSKRTYCAEHESNER